MVTLVLFLKVAESYRKFVLRISFFSASGAMFYHVLGVPKGADEDDIKRAYRKVSCKLF